MSEQQIALWREWLEVFNTRDLEALIALCDANIELHSAFAAVGSAIYHGHDELRTWHRDLMEAWGEEIRVEPEAHFDLGEHVLTFLTYRARGRHSGAQVVMPAATVARFRGRLLSYAKVYLARDAALGDLGISEDELEPLAP